MTYVIGTGRVDVMDRSCGQECPVDCIYEGDRALYIDPDACVDCGACTSICRVEAIHYETDLPDDPLRHLADNAAFFSQTLSGRGGPLGRLVVRTRSGNRCRHPTRRGTACPSRLSRSPTRLQRRASAAKGSAGAEYPSVLDTGFLVAEGVDMHTGLAIAAVTVLERPHPPWSRRF